MIFTHVRAATSSKTNLYGFYCFRPKRCYVRLIHATSTQRFYSPTPDWKPCFWTSLRSVQLTRASRKFENTTLASSTIKYTFGRRFAPLSSLALRASSTIPLPRSSPSERQTYLYLNVANCTQKTHRFYLTFRLIDFFIFTLNANLNGTILFTVSLGPSPKTRRSKNKSHRLIGAPNHGNL